MPYFHPSKNSRAGATDFYRNPLKVLLNKFSITGTTGYGTALYSHEFTNVYFVQSQTDQVIVPIGEELPDLVVGNRNWFNQSGLSDTLDLTNYFDVPYTPIENPVFNENLRGAFRMATDTSALKFQSFAHSIPLTLSVHYNSYKFRIGGGATIERQYFRSFKPKTYKEEIRPLQFDVGPVLFQRYFGMLGYRFYDFWNFSFAAEGQVGILRGGGKVYDYRVVQRGAFYNLGISIEQNLSEYFRVIIKPSYDYHTFNTINTPPVGSAFAVPHKQQTFFIQAGISINIPDIRRCPLPACHIQLKHVHSGEEVRGQPITKHQNPKVGQNHRKLFRYKWLNKRKMEPY